MLFVDYRGCDPTAGFCECDYAIYYAAIYVHRTCLEDALPTVWVQNKQPISANTKQLRVSRNLEHQNEQHDIW